jgi:hypothetical protein
MTDDAVTSSCAVPQRGAAAPAVVVVLPIAVAAAVGALLLLVGGKLLNDPDTLWQVTLGNWIIDHRAVPTVDTFSWTFKGTPWISTQWLAQVLLAQAHTLFGWAGPVLLAALAAALALALLARFLLEKLAAAPVLVVVTGALLITAPHLVARPHVLALPVMVAWMGLLVRSADRGVAPPLPAVLLMALWANLHGGFILGLALIAPLGLDAALNAERSHRATTFAQWFCFGLVATVAACANPYGVDAILASLRIVGLGGALALIGEWKPQDFSTFSAFEGFLLFAIGFALLRGFTLSPLRIVVLLGFVHMALSHERSGEILGLLAPLLIAAPLARHLGSEPPRMLPLRVQAAAYGVALLVLVSIGFAATGFARYAPDPQRSPAAAVQALKKIAPTHLLNEYDFGGYLIASGVAPFIDGRTELYGSAFVVRHHRAVTLRNLPDFVRLLDEYRIDATLLNPQMPAVAFLDRLPGWKRAYTDDLAVIHVRAPRDTSGNVAPAENLGLRR